MTDRKPISDAERTEIIKSLRARYIITPRDATLDAAIKDLIEISEDERIEARGLVVTGLSGAGKSESLRRIFRKHFPDYDQPGADSPLISINVPSPCNMTALGRLALKRLGYPLIGEKRQHRVWELVREHLQMREIKFLHLDEIQNIMAVANVLESKALRDTLKSFLNDTDLRVCLVLSGLPEIAKFLQLDAQERRRCAFLHFESLTLDDAGKIHNELTLYAQDAGLGIERQDQNAIASRLLHAAFYQLGVTFEIAIGAINIALKAGADRLTCRHVADEYARRTGCAAPANPFLATDWSAIDCSLVLQEDAIPALLQQPPPATRAASSSGSRSEKPRPNGRGF